MTCASRLRPRRLPTSATVVTPTSFSVSTPVPRASRQVHGVPGSPGREPVASSTCRRRRRPDPGYDVVCTNCAHLPWSATSGACGSHPPRAQHHRPRHRTPARSGTALRAIAESALVVRHEELRRSSPCRLLRRGAAHPGDRGRSMALPRVGQVSAERHPVPEPCCHTRLACSEERHRQPARGRVDPLPGARRASAAPLQTHVS